MLNKFSDCYKQMCTYIQLKWIVLNRLWVVVKFLTNNDRRMIVFSKKNKCSHKFRPFAVTGAHRVNVLPKRQTVTEGKVLFTLMDR